MEIKELVKMVHEFAGKGFSLNLSPNGVRDLSAYLEGAFKDSCPECGEKIWLSKRSSVLGEGDIFRLNCQCGWHGRQYELQAP